MKSELIPRRDILWLTVPASSALLSFSRQSVAEGEDAKQPSRGNSEFFHLRRVQGKWVLFTPQRRPIFMRGLNHYGDGSLMPLNLQERYGSRKAWRKSVRDRHEQWGFNYLPPSVGPSEPTDKVARPEPTETGGRRWPTEIRRTPEWPAKDFAELDYPFAGFLDIPRQYVAGPGLPDVFSKDFRDMVDQKCQQQVAPLAEDKNLIGWHFAHNPPWDHTNRSFHTWLHDITAKPDGRQQWTRLMRQIYGTVDRWRGTYGIPIQDFDDINDLDFPLRGYVNDSEALRDKIAFMQRVCEEWFRVFCSTVRKYDPNHLLLGDRNTIHLHPLPEYAIHVMAKYVDVLSVNAMGPMRFQLEGLEQVTRTWDGPIHLADTGAGIYDGGYAKSAYQAGDLLEFEELYRSYMEVGLTHPQLIGFGWCGYYETPSSRSGLVDSRDDEPLQERVAVMKKWNLWMEDRYRKRFEI